MHPVSSEKQGKKRTEGKWREDFFFTGQLIPRTTTVTDTLTVPSAYKWPLRFEYLSLNSHSFALVLLTVRADKPDTEHGNWGCRPHSWAVIQLFLWWNSYEAFFLSWQMTVLPCVSRLEGIGCYSSVTMQERGEIQVSWAILQSSWTAKLLCPLH